MSDEYCHCTYMNNKIVTLDHIENISIDWNTPPIHNMHALYNLPRGLYFLACIAREQENCAIAWWKTISGPSITKDALPVSYSPTEIVDRELCSCIFHWFSVSLVNYLRLVALMQFAKKNQISIDDFEKPSIQKKVESHCSDYAKRICPDIVTWRHKVGAHMAITSPRPEDNIATIYMSAMTSVDFKKDRLYTAFMKWGRKGHVSELPTWSITETFETLSPRFWPNCRLPEHRY